MLPELAGIGATPAARASLAGVAKRCAPAISPTSLAAVKRSEPRLGEQLRCDRGDELGDLCLERLDRLRELADAPQLVAGDPDAHRLLGPGEPPGDARCPAAIKQRAAGQLELGPEIVQMPLQRAVEPDALTNEPFAVINQQPQIELAPIQVRDREGLQALAQRGAGDGQRIDRVRLPALTSALARAGRQVRRDPQHPLAAGDQKPLQSAGDVPAVLKRPHPLAIKAARPPHQRIEAALADLDGLLAQQLAGRGRDRGDRVRTLVSVRAKHDHGPRPPL